MGGGLLSSALALTLTATAVLSPFGASNVRAAEITDKPYIDFEITGNYTEKTISDADVTALAKAFGYDMATTGVYICSADAKGYIDWENSAIASWQVYQTEVFQPVLSKDGNGNLTVATDENGEVQKAWSTYATYPTETADVVSHRTEDAEKIKSAYFPDNSNNSGGGSNIPYFGHTYYMTNEELNQNTFYEESTNYTDAFVQGRGSRSFIDYVLSENHFCLSAECDRHIQTINSHLGLTELTTWKAISTEEQMQKFYESEQTQITDAYVIRVYYTADDIPMNWVRRCESRYLEKSGILDLLKVSDVYGNVYRDEDVAIYDMPFDEISITTENRTFRYTDIWILPEGVETVLTLEDSTDDSTTNAPSNTPSDSTNSSDDNTSSDSNTSNDNTSSDSNNTPSDSNNTNTPNDTTDNTTSSDTTDTSTSSGANDTVATEPYVVDFSNADSQTVSKEAFASLLEANKESDVVIKSNNGVTFTFAKGTMSEVEGKESYDFSTSINNTYNDSMPSYIQKNSFVSQINFNYSGKLPATASICFYVGTEYAGKTLYYSLMNEDNTFARINSYVVDAEGYITVQQDHCSSYVLTTKELKSPKTNDTMVLFPVGILLLATGGIFMGMKKRKMV